MPPYHYFRNCVGAVIHDNVGRFLLAQRAHNDDLLPGKWAIPAGHVEADESNVDVLEESLRREVHEEIGVEITIERLLDTHVYVGDNTKKLYTIFLCTIAGGTPAPLCETAAVRWVTLDEAHSMDLAPQVDRMLGKAAQELARD